MSTFYLHIRADRYQEEEDTPGQGKWEVHKADVVVRAVSRSHAVNKALNLAIARWPGFKQYNAAFWQEGASNVT